MSDEPWSEGTCHVYIIAHSSDGQPRSPVKIGISSDPMKRLASIQTANPNRLLLLCTFATPTRDFAKILEAAFHKRMAEHRLAGEWFDLQPMRSVELMCNNFRAAFRRFLSEEPEIHAQAMETSGLLENERKLAEWKAEGLTCQ